MEKDLCISVAELKNILSGIPKGQFFFIEFARATPKCLKCDYKSKSLWQNKFDDLVCPKCGGEISRYRESKAQLGVSNPSSALKPGTGMFDGESFEHAWANGRMKYFDPEAVNDAGGLGDYRQARIENIIRLSTGGKRYKIIPNL